MLYIRKANKDDFEQIMKIYRTAQDYMIQSGNPHQWGHFYPDSEIILSDIQEEHCNVIYDDNGIHGVFSLFEGVESTYKNIEKGEWLNDEAYVTIHRIAGDGLVHGLFRRTSDYCKSIYKNIRIDTHGDNITMQRAIENNGFTKCGIIYVNDGTPRIAYQWTND